MLVLDFAKHLQLRLAERLPAVLLTIQSCKGTKRDCQFHSDTGKPHAAVTGRPRDRRQGGKEWLTPLLLELLQHPKAAAQPQPPGSTVLDRNHPHAAQKAEPFCKGAAEMPDEHPSSWSRGG